MSNFFDEYFLVIRFLVNFALSYGYSLEILLLMMMIYRATGDKGVPFIISSTFI